MEKWFQHQWMGLSGWHILLIPLSLLFGVLSGLRRYCYRAGLFRSEKLPVPVVVVGNISVGGTGKTPLVIWLVNKLKQAGYNPAIISRGYGSIVTQPLSVNFKSDPCQVGDEPVLLSRRCNCPVWVGPNRVETAQALLAEHPQCDVIVSDDGLQHYALQRDFEIAVVDSTRGFGNGRLLPAGPLRESISRLKTVDAVVYNGDTRPQEYVNPESFIMQLESDDFHNLNHPETKAAIAEFKGRRVCAIAGIGNPQRFFQQLSQAGLQFESRSFPDHHNFQAEDLQIGNADVILMTEKDAVKCIAFAKPDWWYLPVNAVITDALLKRVMGKIRL
jgi:tetraacyldisaccharide 4'-kinase